MSYDYEHTDRDGDSLTVQQASEAAIFVGVSNGVMVHVSADKRRDVAQAVAGEKYRVILADTRDHRAALEAEIQRLGQECDDLAKQLHEAEVQAAQPDRPEPVDPASVRIGDFVELTYAGKVQEIRGGDSLALEPGERHFAFKGAQIRVLQPAEPEPDEAAVEALRDAMASTSEIVTDPESGDYSITDWARELIRRGVYVEVSE